MAQKIQRKVTKLGFVAPNVAMFLVSTLLLLISVAVSVPVYAQPIVYVRCARTDAPLDVSATIVVGGVTQQVTRTLQGLDGYDVMPDVSHFLGGFSVPCDLMFRGEDGDERVLYDCSSTSTGDEACAAMDPAVSFDGRTVAFSVFRGTKVHPKFRFGQKLFNPNADSGLATGVSPSESPGAVLSATEAQLHLVDIATGDVTPLPFVPGRIDAGPAFLPGARLAFTSTRDGHLSTNVWGSTSIARGSRIWTMDMDGRNVDLASHHSLSQEQHPFALRDGRLAYSSWQIGGGVPFRYTNGSPGGFTTLQNLFMIFTQNPDGAHNFAFFGQHSGDHDSSYFGASHVAAHFLTQDPDGRVWLADYYRANNNGLGVVVGVMPEPEGQEGIGPQEATSIADVFAPRDAIRLTTWSTNADDFSKISTTPPLRVAGYTDAIPFLGKVGHPTALPDGSLLVAWGKGPCSTVVGNGVFGALGRTAPPLTSGSGQGTYVNVMTSLGLDIPACDLGIYRTTAIPSEHPSDLQPVVDTREWHEFMARPVVPYQALHGIDEPTTRDRADVATSHQLLEVGTPFGLLGAASIVDRETHPRDGIHFMGERQFNLQGTDTIDFEDADLCGVRILGVMPNRGRRNDEYNAMKTHVFGERVTILGEVPVRHLDSSGNAVRYGDGEEDTSFLLRMPANMPYFMQGIDCEGRTLNTDQSWQSLRPGEKKTCGGCHVHSRLPEYTFEETYAARTTFDVPRLGEGSVPLLAGRTPEGVRVREVESYGLQIEFDRDVLPILQNRCATAGCHTQDAAAGGLALDVGGTNGFGRDGMMIPSAWYCLVADRGQSCVPADRRIMTGVGWNGMVLRRPQLTRYVRAYNARGSLLYWKAAGERTDNRDDTDFGPDASVNNRDIDYGESHPDSGITPDELGMLSRWIDVGSPGGTLTVQDTQKPTLHLAAIIDGDRVMELRVGTADLGSGIDQSSLEVCVLDSAGDCSDLSGEAALAGVIQVPLTSPLVDPDLEVRARVLDIAGNETVVVRTVGWLLGTPPPPPLLPPDMNDDESDDNMTDAGNTMADAGIGTGAGDAGAESSASSEGCGCRVSGRSPKSGWILAIALLCGVIVARRQRWAR